MALQITDANFEELVNGVALAAWYLLSLMSWQPNTKVV